MTWRKDQGKRRGGNIAQAFVVSLFLIISISSISAQFGYDNPNLPKIQSSVQTTSGGGGNASFNVTFGNTQWWRLDGTNAPPTANWNMGNRGFVNVGNSNFTGNQTFFGATNLITNADPKLDFQTVAGGFPTADFGYVSWNSLLSNSGVSTATLTAADSGYGYGYGTSGSPFYVSQAGVTFSISDDGSNTIWDTNGQKDIVRIQGADAIQISTGTITMVLPLEVSSTSTFSGAMTGTSSLLMRRSTTLTEPLQSFQRIAGVNQSRILANGNWRINEDANKTMTFTVYGNLTTTELFKINSTDNQVTLNGTIKLNANVTTVPCNSFNEGALYYDGSQRKHFGCNSTTWNALY